MLRYAVTRGQYIGRNKGISIEVLGLYFGEFRKWTYTNAFIAYRLNLLSIFGCKYTTFFQYQCLFDDKIRGGRFICMYNRLYYRNIFFEFINDELYFFQY